LPAETVTPVPARLAPLAEQALPGPDGRVVVPALPPVAAQPPQVAQDDGQFEPRHAAAENPLLAPEPPSPPPVVEETRAASYPGATATTAIAMPVTPPIQRQEQLVQPTTAPASGDADGTRVVLRFTGDTWVQVKERGGQALVTKVMKAGETFPVPSRANLVLNTGNAGRVEILVDGVVVPSIGGPGSVRKDVALDPDQLKAGPPMAIPGRR
jgi:cytoskeleton protein RodZ